MITRVRASTFKSRRFYLENQVIPFFQDRPLSSISAKDIKQFYAYLKKQGYQPKTISTIHKFITTLFQSALENKDLSESPMDGLQSQSKPKDPTRIAHPWSYTEMNDFLNVAYNEGKGTMYDFTLRTGLRQGEVFALPWYNVDLERKTVTVTRSVSFDEYGEPELIVKGPGSYRTLKITDYLVEKLKQHKEEQDRIKERFGKHYHHELDLVFPKTNGGYHNPSNVRRQLYKLMKKAKVRRITFHDLRHTHASMLIQSGSQPRIVQLRLGHQDIKTTFKYYGHLWDNADEHAVNALEEELEKQITSKNKVGSNVSRCVKVEQQEVNVQ